MTKLKPLTPKVNFLVKSKTEMKHISRLLKGLFLLFYVVFALDFGFLNFESATMKKFVKLFPLTQSSALTIYLCYIYLFTHSFGISFWYTLDVLVYYLLGIVLLISKYSFREFLLDLHSFDTQIQVDSDCYKGQYVFLFLFLCLVVFRIATTFFNWSSYVRFRDYPDFATSVYFLVLVGLNVVLLVYSFLFQSVYSRMKKFTSFVRNESTDVVSCHYLYKNIVEITEKAKKTFDWILVLGLVYSTIDVILSIYLPFAHHEALQMEFQREGPMLIGLVLQELILMFASAFTAGLLSSQVDSLKLVLFDLLVKEQKHATDIRRFINYIDARPLRFKVWMVIPLDWSLPVIVINISVTYLIVMIQFTQK